MTGSMFLEHLGAGANLIWDNLLWNSRSLSGFHDFQFELATRLPQSRDLFGVFHWVNLLGTLKLVDSFSTYTIGHFHFLTARSENFDSDDKFGAARPAGSGEIASAARKLFWAGDERNQQLFRRIQRKILNWKSNHRPALQRESRTHAKSPCLTWANWT